VLKPGGDARYGKAGTGGGHTSDETRFNGGGRDPNVLFRSKVGSRDTGRGLPFGYVTLPSCKISKVSPEGAKEYGTINET